MRMLSLKMPIILVFTLPMRNWNLVNVVATSFLNHVFTLPMRNWNILGHSLHRHHLPVFTLPMRNWNKLWGTVQNQKINSFYFTYEELKLRRERIERRKWIKFLLYLWGIETNMELPPPFRISWVFTLPMRNWNIVDKSKLSIVIFGFYFTYEELKLSSIFASFPYLLTTFVNLLQFSRQKDKATIKISREVKKND